MASSSPKSENRKNIWVATTKTAWFHQHHRFKSPQIVHFLPKWRIRSQEPSQCTHNLPASPGSVAATTVLWHSFLRHGWPLQGEKLRNEDHIYEDVFFEAAIWKVAGFQLPICYGKILFRWMILCAESLHAKNNFQKTSFWRVSSENGIWMIHSLPSLCLQNRLCWHEIPQLLLLIETQQSMHVAIFCPCHEKAFLRPRGTPFGRANAASNSWGPEVHVIYVTMNHSRHTVS